MAVSGPIRRTFGWAAIASLVVACGCDSGASPRKSLTFYCAAGMRKPVEAIVESYQQTHDVDIAIQYGGSGTLLTSLQLADAGDLYLAGDQSYIARGRELGCIAESIPIATMQVVLAVGRGNPRGLMCFEDALADGVRLALANPDAAAVGKASRRALEAHGLWQRASDHARVFKPTVGDVANDLRVGAVDAALIWDATAAQYDDIDVIAKESSALFADTQQRVAIGVMTKTRDAPAALHFARYLTSREHGLPQFREHGFTTTDGDAWAERPRVLLYSGAMLRPGIRETVAAFEKREGVDIDTVYNGCGILVAQIESGAHPSAYLSCDVSFMQRVADRFGAADVLSENDLVLLVAHGNPLAIRGLDDLATRDAIRLGLAHPTQSALGALTARLIEGRGLGEPIRARVVVDSATGDFLVNQIVAGALDATIVYRSNALANPRNLAEHIALIDIDDPAAIARQPIAIARDTEHRRLLERLFERLKSDDSRQCFEHAGFHWIAK